MFTVIYTCIAEQHDLRLVVLAGLLCLFSCFTAANLYLHAAEATGKSRTVWHAAAAIVFGSGVWATHFVAELAYEPGVPIGYDIDLTLLSIAIAMIVTWFGIAIALRYKMPEVGGAIVGAAVGSMHFVGMAALRMPAMLHWNFAYVGVSLAIGICLAALAMHVLSRGTTLRYRLAATTLLVLAICGLHFTAMSAVVLELNPSVDVAGQVIAPELLAIAIAAVTVLIVALGLSGAFVDDQLARRAASEAERLTRRVEERTAELEKAQEQLLRQERFSALGELMATVAHELRNPMSAIANTAFTIKQSVAGNPLDLSRPIGRLERSVARCERIINDMVDFSSLREIQCRSVTADTWLATVLDHYKLPDGISLVRRLEAPGQQINLDDGLMHRALDNLIENASQALSDVDGSARDRVITVVSRIRDGRLELGIEDTGNGIPEEILSRVFDPLFSTKSFGTGLGLALVKQIVEQHGGSIAIRSAPEEGTKVAILLPLPVEARKAAA